MVSKKMFLKKERKKYETSKSEYTKKGRGNREDYVESRMEKYVNYDTLSRKNVPLTDMEIRNFIRDTVTEDPKLSFLKDQDEQNWDKLIPKFKKNSRYNKSLNELIEDINIEDTGKLRRGIKVPKSKNYYFIVVKGYTFKNGKSKGKRVGSYKRYYNVKTGRVIGTDKVEKYMGMSSKTSYGEMKEFKNLRKNKK